MNTLPNTAKYFKGRHFDAEMILLCVRWYVTYKLSYRDLVEMMEERGISLAHTTILRWVQRYIPVFEKRWRKTHRNVGNSWYVNETYCRVKGTWTYLYRAATNASVNVLRTRRRRENYESQALGHALVLGDRGDEAPDAQVLEGEVLAAVAKALLAVKEQHRRMLVLRVVWGLTNTEIAEREGIPLPTVGTWLRRGREELRRALRPVLRELR